MTLELFGSNKSAIVSPCGRYRYRLDRTWDPGSGRIAWVMLNPSTADATDDDPTLRRVIASSQRWGFGALSVVNLFAWRSTNPHSIPLDSTAIGPDANAHIREVLAASDRVICGWGNSVPTVRRHARESDVLDLIRDAGGSPECLGITKDGAPRHPLYLRGDTLPIAYDRKPERKA